MRVGRGNAPWVIFGILGDVFRFPLWPVLQYLELLWLQVKKMRENEWKVSGLVPGCSWLEESFL